MCGKYCFHNLAQLAKVWQKIIDGLVGTCVGYDGNRKTTVGKKKQKITWSERALGMVTIDRAWWRKKEVRIKLVELAKNY